MAAIKFGSGRLSWDETDFTPSLSDKQNLHPSSKSYGSGAAMGAGDSLEWMDGGGEQLAQAYNSAASMYQNGPALSAVQEMEQDLTSSGHASQATSRGYSYSEPEGAQTSSSSLPSPMEKICPLLSGRMSECNPQICGPEAACLDFSHIDEIEDCTSISYVPSNPSNNSDLTETSPQAPMSMSDPKSLHTSTSPPEKSTGNSYQPSKRESRQRLRRSRLDSAGTKSLSKKAHSLVEKRYRENLNGNIAQLHVALQKTRRVGQRSTPQDQDDDMEELNQASSKVRKSDVMVEAVDYVYQTEVELRHMADEIELLRTRARQLEKLVKCEDCALMKELVSFSL